MKVNRIYPAMVAAACAMASAGCGDNEFVGSTNNEDAGYDAGADAKDAAHDGTTDAKEAGMEAATEAGNDALTESGTDSGLDGTAGDADASVAMGACGIIPTDGWWICYVLPHPQGPNDLVGLAGAILPPGITDAAQYWLDPMQGIFGKCVSANAGENFVECALGKPDSKTSVIFTAGLHADAQSPTVAGTAACDQTTCQGVAEVYHDGKTVGGFIGAPSGLVYLTPHFDATRKDLAFQIP